MRPSRSLVSIIAGLLLGLAGAATALAAAEPGPFRGAEPLPGKVPNCAEPAEVFDPRGGPPIIVWLAPYQPCPGPPAEIQDLTQTRQTVCGATDLLTFDVTDAFGFNVADGTVVRFVASMGHVQATAGTRGGIAQVSFLAAPRLAGTAVIEASAGQAAGSKTLEIACS
jgi:hypothetical protein